MGIVLGSANRPAPPPQVADFINTAHSRRIDVEAAWVAETGGRIVWAVLPIINPGRTLLLLTSSDVAPGNHPAARLVSDLCGHFARDGMQLAQVLLESRYQQARHFFRALGFSEIAELIYLQGNLPRNVAAPELPAKMRWVGYSPQTHGLFARAIGKTYQDSLDCPALSGLRDIDDVIQGHKATGEFDPACWCLLAEGDEPRGVVLVSRIPQTDAMELVYLGLAPEARGRGLGMVLMRQVFFLIHAQQRRRLSLAVDSKNEPALKLYYRFGMQQVATRWAMICRLQSE
jgi:ribosomal protein S18 acetylase RimI-like enzyme